MASKRHINDLPPEMHTKIFDYLSFEDRKGASLVCHQWKTEVFTASFLDQVSFRVTPEQFYAVCKSDRQYRHIHFCKQIKREWPTVLAVLEKFTESIDSLSIVFYTTKQLWEIYQRTMELKQLTLEVSCHELVFEMEFLPNWYRVKELTINYNTSDEIAAALHFVAPHVSSFTIEWRSMSFLGNSLGALRRIAPQLTYVDLGEIKPDDNINEFTLQQFFRLATNLTTAVVRFAISYEIYDTIVNSCKNLEMLLIHIDLLYTSDLEILEKLTNLKVLRIRCKKMLQTRKILHLPLLDVHTFCLQLESNPSIPVIEYFGKRFPYVRTFKAMIGGHRERMSADVLNQICYNFRRLKVLTVYDRSYSSSLPMGDFQQLQYLYQLEELNLTNVDLTIPKLPLTTIRRLRLNRCKFEVNQVVKLRQVMPKLQYLGFRDSIAVKRHISELALALPNCKVEMNDYYRYQQVHRIFCVEL